MRILQNYVLISPDPDFDKVKITGPNGTELLIQLDTTYNPGYHFVTSGTVKQLPEKLLYNPKSGYEASLRFKTEMEVEVGDHVIFHYQAIDFAKRNELKIGDAYLVKYDSLMIRKRNGEVYPLNGIVITKPLDANIDLSRTKLLRPGDAAIKMQKMKSKILYVGKALQQYMDTGSADEISDQEALKPGTVVVHSKLDAVPLQYTLHTSIHNGEQLYRMHMRDIDAIVTAKETEVVVGDDIVLLNTEAVDKERTQIHERNEREQNNGDFKKGYSRYNKLTGEVEFVESDKQLGRRDKKLRWV